MFMRYKQFGIPQSVVVGTVVSQSQTTNSGVLRAIVVQQVWLVIDRAIENFEGAAWLWYASGRKTDISSLCPRSLRKKAIRVRDFSLTGSGFGMFDD